MIIITTFVTTEQAAALQNCSVRYIQALVKKGKIKAEIKETAANNRCEYLIPIKELSPTSQRLYYKNQQKELGLLPKSDPEKSEKAKLAIDTLTADERHEVALWTRILNEWQDTRQNCKDYDINKTEIDELFVAKMRLMHPNLQINVKTLYRKIAAMNNGDLAVLVDKRGGANRGYSSINDEMKSVFLDMYLNDRKISVSKCYNLLKAWAAENRPQDLQNIPSERTFRRMIETIPKAVITHERDGEKAFDDKYQQYTERLYDDLKANDVWIADNHTFDFMTKGEHGKIHRLYLTAFMDAKSGVIVGWNLTENPCSYSTLLALRHAIIRFGLPVAVYFDNGSEFLTHDIGGRGHRKKANWNSEDNPPTILESLGIKMYNAKVRNAKAKPIERAFYTLKEHISRLQDTFCGGTILERPESHKYKIKHGIIPEDEQIRDLLSNLLDYGYNIEPYGGNEQCFKGKTRIDVWNESIKNTTFRTAAESDLPMLLARTTRYQKVKRNGITIDFAGGNLTFNCGIDTYKYVGKEVYARYDPAWVWDVRVYDRENDQYIATWKLADYLSVDYITDNNDDIAAAEKNKNLTKKAVKQYKKDLIKDLPNDEKIDILALAVIESEQNKNKFEIKKPTTFVPVVSDEIVRQKPDMNNITSVTIDMNKLNENSIKRIKRIKRKGNM